MFTWILCIPFKLLFLLKIIKHYLIFYKTAFSSKLILEEASIHKIIKRSTLKPSLMTFLEIKKFGVFKDFLMYFTIIGPSKIGCFVGFSLQTNLGFLYTVVVRYPLVSSNVTSIPNIVRISLVDNVEQLIVIFVIHTFCYVMKIKGHYNNLCIK